MILLRFVGVVLIATSVFSLYRALV
jgi:hypothetical protein